MESRFIKWVKEKRVHSLFPLLTSCVGIWVGNMLNQPLITVFTLTLSLYLALVIFVPWEKVLTKFTKHHSLMQYIIPSLLCIAIAVPLWNNIVNIFPSQNPSQQLIRTATATVEIYVKSEEDINTHYMDRGGYLIFAKGDEALLITSAQDSYGRQMGDGVFLYRGVFNMDATSEATQQQVSFLEQTEYIQIRFSPMPEKSQILNGKAIVVINNSVRFELVVPSQQMRKDFIIIPNVQKYLIDMME